MRAETLPKLHRLKLEGFKSIAALDLTFSDLDVLIGPNGAGKSNLIGFLRLLSFMLSSDTGLQVYTGRAGGASSLLHDGPKSTKEIVAELSIETQKGMNDYAFRLGYAADDSFIFLDERCRFSEKAGGTNPRWIELGAGHRSPQLLKPVGDQMGKTQRTILSLLRGLVVYQFHDTSLEASIKQRAKIDDVNYLRDNGGNIAAFLLTMREREPLYYERIRDHIRLVAPFFEDFDLSDQYGTVLLRWREIGSDLSFGPHQMSDGTLRAIALITLLLQPARTMPPMIIIDEPELGLHPFGIKLVSGLIKSASVRHQCLIATQSPTMLDEFDPSEVIVVERKARSSSFQRLEADALASWLDDYSLSDIWAMNMIGGRPKPLAAE